MLGRCKCDVAGVGFQQVPHASVALSQFCGSSFEIMGITMQVKRHFSRCQIVGTRFPIALVHWGGIVLEVSSFGTRAKRETIPTDAAALLSWPPSHNKASPCQHRVRTFSL